MLDSRCPMQASSQKMRTKPSIFACSFLLLICGLAEAALAVNLPSDFNGTQGTNGIYFESIGDNRSSNTQHQGPPGASLMDYHASFGYPPSGNLPTYNHQSSFPMVQNDSPHNLLIMHPGTGGYDLGTGSSNLGSSIRFLAGATGVYSVVGDFARDNVNIGAGNGIDALIARQLDLDNPVMATKISASHAVDTTNPFSGTSNVHFNLTLRVNEGDSLRFVVFTDGQGQDGTYDSTAFRVAIQPRLALPGDANLDSSVNGADYTNWADNFQRSGKAWTDGDFTGDGKVSAADYTIWADNFQFASALPIPEPSGSMLFAIGVILILAFAQSRNSRRLQGSTE